MPAQRTVLPTRRIWMEDTDGCDGPSMRNASAVSQPRRREKHRDDQQAHISNPKPASRPLDEALPDRSHTASEAAGRFPIFPPRETCMTAIIDCFFFPSINILINYSIWGAHFFEGPERSSTLLMPVDGPVCALWSLCPCKSNVDAEVKVLCPNSKKPRQFTKLCISFPGNRKQVSI